MNEREVVIRTRDLNKSFSAGGRQQPIIRDLGLDGIKKAFKKA